MESAECINLRTLNNGTEISSDGFIRIQVSAIDFAAMHLLQKVLEAIS